jgi:hypothetical protein
MRPELLRTGFSDPLLQATSHAPGAAAPRAIYLGFGVATRSALATGVLPFDALGMILLAERCRRASGAGRVVHLIADDHAALNRFARPSAIAASAETMEDELRRVVAALGYRGYTIVRASALSDSDHDDLHLAALDACADPYAARQAADVEWARRRHGATVKVGWTLEPRLALAAKGHDERYFDDVHAQVFGENVTYMYGLPGRTLDAERPRTSPYALLPGEPRLTLRTPPAAIAGLCGGKHMRKHLGVLCSAAERELELPGAADPAARVAAILDRLRLRA